MGIITNISTEIVRQITARSLTRREIAVTYGMCFVGTWYSWGGDDPSGFDCSGVVVEILQAAGAIPRNSDYSADALSKIDKFKKVTDAPYRGCLVFYENDNHEIIHVEILINDMLSLGASGGGSHVKTKEDAIKYNAFIKIRPWASRKGACLFLDPFYGDAR